MTPAFVPSQIHVLLWSFSQGCFHRETLDLTVKAGIEAYAQKHTFQDYIVLAVANDPSELNQVREALVTKFGHRAPTRKFAKPAKR